MNESNYVVLIGHNLTDEDDHRAIEIIGRTKDEVFQIMNLMLPAGLQILVRPEDEVFPF